ncbi:MAG TPA: DMT family transporter, partial [Bacillota bacterium]|nr:DMT family transporter [Bacillota bacterium]
RLGFTILFMAPFFIFKHLGELRYLGIKNLLLSTIAGIFLAMHFILWFESLNYTSVASSVVLVTLQPLFSFLGGYIFFKEKLTFKSILAGLFALSGSIVIGWGDFRIGGNALWGDILALLGAGAVTGYWLFGQGLRKSLSLITYTFLVYGTSTLTLIIYNLILGYSFFPYSKQDWLMFILLALIPTLLGHTLFNWLIKWMNATTISMSILGEPVGSSLLAYFILGEIVTVPQWIGGIIIIFGIYIFMQVQSTTTTKDNKKNSISQENVE